MHKLGFYLHLSLDQHGLWDAIRRVQPPVLLIHADTANTMLLEEIRRFRAPDAFVIGRMFKDNHTQRQILESDRPAEQGRAMADEILRYDFGLATKRGANGRLLIDAWMSLNEAVPGPASEQFRQQPEETGRLLRNYDHFQAAFRERLQEADVEAVAFNFGAGNFTTGRQYMEFFPETLGSYTYLGFHEYGWPTLFPNFQRQSATSAGLYRACMQEIRLHYGTHQRAIITEAGLTRMYKNPAWGDKGWLNRDEPLTEEEYWASLEWYNAHLMQDSYALGACLYEVGHHGDWESFRHLGQDNEGRTIHLIDRLVALKDAPTPVEPTPPAPPSPPQRVTIEGVVTLRGAPVSNTPVRLVGSQETLGTLQDAASVAPTYVTWTRQLQDFAGSRWNCWNRFVAQEVAGISWDEFEDLVGVYNPTLANSDQDFQADQSYVLPENQHWAEIAWDRPLTNFQGNVWRCWQQHVENKVVGLTYDDFKQEIFRYNEQLVADGQFLAEKRYNLPRNVGQTEYAVVRKTRQDGHFTFADLPPGDYRLEVAAEGARPFSTAFSCQETVELDVILEPLSEPELATARSAAADFVRVQDAEFLVGNRPLRFIGANIRGLVHYGDGRTLPHAVEQHRIEQLQAARNMGARVVRIFLPSRHVSPEQTEAQLRTLLALMQAQFPDIYLLPALTNLYDDVPFRVPGDDRFYQNNVLIREFFTGGYRENYLAFAEQMVTTFANEPRIFAWEIGNELKLDRSNPSDPHDPNPMIFINFIHEMARRIRSLDSNHLITTGMISTRHAWLFEQTFKRRLYDIDELDFVTIHAYQGSNEEDDSPLAKALNKPFIVEEAGFDAAQNEDRSERVAADMEKWFGLGARGYLQWGFMATSDNGDGDRRSGMDRVFHGDWDGLMHIYRERARALAQVAPPVQPTNGTTKPPTSNWQPGQIVHAHTVINVRRSAGHVGKAANDVLGQLALGAQATITGASTTCDGLMWWPIRATLTNEQTVKGWAAQAIPGQILLGAAQPLFAVPRGFQLQPVG